MFGKSKRGPIRLEYVAALLCVVTSLSSIGCTSLVQPIQTIPASRVPRQFLAEPQASKQPIDFSRLRQIQSDEYLLGAGDILGIFIGNIVGNQDEPPPVHFPEPGSDLPPAVGYPFLIRDDGTLALPLIRPIPVEGLSVAQVEELVRTAYTEGEEPLLGSDNARIIVTLMKERTYRVTVVRQDNAMTGNSFAQGLQAQYGVAQNRTDYSGRGFVLDLPVGKNDVMTALAETGGLPGVNAKAEVKILRGNKERWDDRDRQVMEWVKMYGQQKDPCTVPPPLPEDENELRIPLRLFPGQIPQITQEDIVLEDGDIVVVEARDAEFFYTGGNLPGGQFPLPRDFDLDVFGAIAMAGGSVGAQTPIGGGLIGGGVGGVPPGELIILRKTDNGSGQIAISVDLTQAINSPKSRLLVKAGDTLILRYKPEEEALNFGLGAFFTFGIRELFRD